MLAGPAYADDLAKMSENPADWVMPAAHLRQPALLDAQADQRQQRREATGGMDVLNRRPARSRRCTAGRWQHDVRAHAIPQHRLRTDLDHDAKILWKYEPKQDPNVIPVMCCDTVNRGVSYGDGKIFLPSRHDAGRARRETGKVVWSVKNGDPSKGQTGTSRHT